MKKLLCKLHIHNWEKDLDLSVVNEKEIICRTYNQCRWCGKFSWVRHFKRFVL